MDLAGRESSIRLEVDGLNLTGRGLSVMASEHLYLLQPILTVRA